MENKVLMEDAGDHIKMFKFCDMPRKVRHAISLTLGVPEKGSVEEWNLCADPNERYAKKVDKWLMEHGADFHTDEFVRIMY